MKYLTCYIFLTLTFFFITSLAFSNEDTDCAYCGDWIPFDKEPYLPHLPGEHLSVTKSTIALPGCSKVDTYILLTNIDLANEIKSDANKKLPPHTIGLREYETTVLKTDRTVSCTQPLQDIPTGSVIEIVLGPVFQGNREMTLTAFNQDAFPELKESYIYYKRSDGIFQPGKVRPKSFAKWSLIHKDHKPGEEGSMYGAEVARQAGLYEADGTLNLQWRQLINILSDNQRSIVTQKQRKWLKLVDKKCKHSTICRDIAYTERTEHLKSAYECVLSGNIQCFNFPASKYLNQK